MEFLIYGIRKRTQQLLFQDYLTNLKRQKKGEPSRNISPSGLACPICCALKLRGISNGSNERKFQVKKLC